jgi:hypothetical protein
MDEVLHVGDKLSGSSIFNVIQYVISLIIYFYNIIIYQYVIDMTRSPHNPPFKLLILNVF